MLKIATIIGITASLCFSYDYNLKPVKITNSVHCFFGKLEAPNKKNNGNMVNTCYVDQGDHYVVIDSGPTKLYAKQANETMNKIKSQKVKYVLNTHTHDDHINGNDYYASKGAVVIGSSKMEEQSNHGRMENLILPEAYNGTKEYMPDLRVGYETKEFGDIKAISLSDHGHTKGDLVFLDKSSKVLFTGDLVFNGRVPSLRDGDINGWIEALDAIDSIDFKYMVSGHGFDISKNAHVMTKKYFSKIREMVRVAIEDGVEIDTAAKKSDIKEYEDKALYNELHSKNVFRAYQLLEWE